MTAILMSYIWEKRKTRNAEPRAIIRSDVVTNLLNLSGFTILDPLDPAHGVNIKHVRPTTRILERCLNYPTTDLNLYITCHVDLTAENDIRITFNAWDNKLNPNQYFGSLRLIERAFHKKTQRLIVTPDTANTVVDFYKDKLKSLKTTSPPKPIKIFAPIYVSLEKALRKPQPSPFALFIGLIYFVVIYSCIMIWSLSISVSLTALAVMSILFFILQLRLPLLQSDRYPEKSAAKDFVAGAIMLPGALMFYMPVIYSTINDTGFQILSICLMGGAHMMIQLSLSHRIKSEIEK